MENNQVTSVDSVTNNQIQQHNNEKLSDKARTLVSLIVRILVNATLKECNEKGDKVSSVQ